MPTLQRDKLGTFRLTAAYKQIIAAGWQESPWTCGFAFERPASPTLANGIACYILASDWDGMGGSQSPSGGEHYFDFSLCYIDKYEGDKDSGYEEITDAHIGGQTLSLDKALAISEQL